MRQAQKITEPKTLQLPYSPEAEKAVLGLILAGSDKLSELSSSAKISADCFYTNEHRLIFQTILDIDDEGLEYDFITVNERLAKSGFTNIEYLTDLMTQAPLTLKIDHYIDIVRKNYYLRRIIHSCRETSRKAAHVDGDVKDFIAEVEKEFLAIAGEQDKEGGLTSASDTVSSTLVELERRLSQDSDVTGLSSGFTDLDYFTGGWQKSDLVILAARPGMGKTALALNWLINAVKDNKSHAVIFSLEMSKEQLMERLISAQGRIDSTKLRKGNLSDDEQDKLMYAVRGLHAFGNRLMIDETPGISLFEVRSRCRRYKKEHGLDLIIIDYLQLMTGSVQAQKQNREREISEISMGLKALAKELAVPVIALAQLNRGPDARPDKKPKISDLRESGSMEQDADQIMFVYRDEYYNPESEFAGKAEVMIAKNRHGEVGSCLLAWQPNYVSFFNLLKDH